MRVFKEDNWFGNDTFQGMNVVDYQHITADSFLNMEAIDDIKLK